MPVLPWLDSIDAIDVEAAVTGPFDHLRIHLCAFAAQEIENHLPLPVGHRSLGHHPGLDLHKGVTLESIQCHFIRSLFRSSCRPFYSTWPLWQPFQVFTCSSEGEPWAGTGPLGWVQEVPVTLGADHFDGGWCYRLPLAERAGSGWNALKGPTLGSEPHGPRQVDHGATGRLVRHDFITVQQVCMVRREVA